MIYVEMLSIAVLLFFGLEAIEKPESELMGYFLLGMAAIIAIAMVVGDGEVQDRE